MASREALREEAERLIRQYRQIVDYGKHKARFSVLRQSPGGYLTQIRDSHQQRLTRIRTEDELLFEEIRAYLQDNDWENQELLELWDPEHVNTGKAVTKKKDIQQTFYKINREAALEIAKQLRLRNLSGMILIDFIDMTSRQDQQDIMELLRQAVLRDPVQTTVVDMTKLGLVEVTRKKIRKSLYEQVWKGRHE